MRATGRFRSSVFGPDVVGTIATIGAVAAAAALVEAAIVPGLLIGGAAVLAPRLLPRKFWSQWEGGPNWTTPAEASAPSTVATGAPAKFDAGRALTKTITYRVIVTGVDFGMNLFVIGELAGAAALSTTSLVAGPIFYFAHEWAWHYYGPASARRRDPLEASVDVPIPGVEADDGRGHTHVAGVKVSRALAKTVTYEGVTTVSEFTVNYIFVQDLAAAAGLTAFTVAISPIIYFAHEKAWDYYDAVKGRPPAGDGPAPANGAPGGRAKRSASSPGPLTSL